MMLEGVLVAAAVETLLYNSREHCGFCHRSILDYHCQGIDAADG